MAVRVGAPAPAPSGGRHLSPGAAREPSFRRDGAERRQGLRIAVTHSGDSDNTAAIAGNLLGLRFADEVMAHDWRRQVACADLIDRIAGDLRGAGRGSDADLLAGSLSGW